MKFDNDVGSDKLLFFSFEEYDRRSCR
nr:hypothetical protein [Sicyoidochytrium minutum DNA virus]